MNKSQIIRDLFDEGYTISQIANKLGIHYSFVHGVVRRHEEQGERKVTKAEQIRELAAQGKSGPEIVVALSVSHSHVYNVLRRWKNANCNIGKDARQSASDD